MVVHLADEIGPDPPIREAPLSLTALEAVVVATTDDGLQSQVGQRLQHCEVRTPRSRDS